MGSLGGDLIRIPHSEENATLEVFARLGVDQAHFTRMRRDPAFAEYVTKRFHQIDCDVPAHQPLAMSAFQVRDHRKGGQLEWDKTRVKIRLSPSQLAWSSPTGHLVLSELLSCADEILLNDCVLNYLIDHPMLIPEEWKDKKVLFFGTIYKHFAGGLVARFLYWEEEEKSWNWSLFSMDETCFDEVATLPLPT